ncbi:MAG: carboxypeptidase regulatory-like domain-containing protein [Planctomycetes bacterium]|nr:carboxypeptidase regulatory-like domain-containing protein [Planctomycetota bacterium]
MGAGPEAPRRDGSRVRNRDALRDERCRGAFHARRPRADLRLGLALRRSDRVPRPGGPRLRPRGRPQPTAPRRGRQRPRRPRARDHGRRARRVVAADGAPIAKAQVRLEGHFPGGRGVVTFTEADGRFELGHLPPGAWTIAALAEGWLTGKVERVEVPQNRTTDGVDFRLERAPSIAGLVVDEAGAPVAKVRVWGWPSRSGQGAGGTTRDDGSFVIHLPQDEPYALGIENAQGFEPWGGHRAPETTFPPGTLDVRIVLKRVDRVRFRVVDDATSEPVTTFALALEDVPEGGRSWNRFERVPAPTEHARGEVELPARAGKQEVGVLAPGYAPLQITVAPAAEPSAAEPSANGSAGALPVQTLRLARGGALTGRIVLAGAPLASASLRLDRDTVQLDPTKPPSEDPWLDANLGHDLGELAGRKQILAASADGAFRVDDLAPGTYRLTIDGAKAARRVVGGLRVVAGAPQDLGVIELAAEARVTGRVLVPAGSTPVGLDLRLVEKGAMDFGREFEITTADGAFAFGGLPGGAYSLTLGAGAPFVPADVVREVVLAASGSAEVVIDLAGSAPCDVLVRVLRDGRPAPGVRVRWDFVAEVGHVDRPLVTDEHGLARGQLGGGTRGRFVAVAPSGIELARSAEERVLPAGATFEETLSIAAGELVLEFPADFAVPEAGVIHVRLRSPDAPAGTSTNVQVPTAGSPFARFSELRWTSRRVELGQLAAGTYELFVSAQELAPASSPEGARYTSKALGQPVQRSIEVRAGETTVISMP